MVLTINQSKFADFVLDNSGEIHAPRHIKEESLMEKSKQIILIIAKYYLSQEETVIKGSKFHNLLEESEIEFDNSVVKALLELQEKDYFDMSI